MRKSHVFSWSTTVMCLFAALLASACVGREYSDIVYPEEQNTKNTRHILIEAQLIDEKAQNVSGIAIAAQTLHSVDSDVTNSQGKAMLNATIGEEEPIDFHFTSKAIDWTTTFQGIPNDAATVKIVFKMDSLGRVSVAAIEF